MKKELTVTIHCLAYNHEPYIRQCLDGFVMQKTNFRYEAIVHDDASTDSTAAIIKEYAEKYPDIIKPIFETENQYSKKDGSVTGNYMNYIMALAYSSSEVNASMGKICASPTAGSCGILPAASSSLLRLQSILWFLLP